MSPIRSGAAPKTEPINISVARICKWSFKSNKDYNSLTLVQVRF